MGGSIRRRAREAIPGRPSQDDRPASQPASQPHGKRKTCDAHPSPDEPASFTYNPRRGVEGLAGRLPTTKRRPCSEASEGGVARLADLVPWPLRCNT